MAKALMIQGTMSNVGKSMAAAGLCRVFAQDGYKTAPFKSQNMALNSYVTDDGLEMGRAQAVQAQCCNIRPDVRMNPVLLKPSTDMGSQVIVNGKPVGNMMARDYFAYKKCLIPTVMEAYESLAAENDIIVIEGAGSPAELNLKKDDFVNMGLALMLKAPVLLVGDINPGGVFAQLYGTCELLEENEKSMIKGLLVNKFRGDRSLFDDGVRILEQRCGIPVAGVIPYINVDIEEEDSQSERLSRSEKNADANTDIIICVIRLPKMSNYTDFMPLESIKGVSVRYVMSPFELKYADMIIIPGTKSTIDDMIWLRRSGLAEEIKRLHKSGVPVCGICGGYQIMGRTITDECGAESYGKADGLGIFDIHTYFNENKRTVNSQGKINAEGMFAGLTDNLVTGYEIHMGVSEYGDSAVPFIYKDGFKDDVKDGCIAENAFGTYFHGIFENKAFTEYIIDKLYAHKELERKVKNNESYAEYRTKQYDILADCIRKNVDMDMVYKILEAGV